MRYHTQSSYAEKVGVSRQAVYLAVRDGRITATRQGIDSNHPTNLYYEQKALQRKGVIKERTTINLGEDEKDDLDKLLEEKQSVPMPALKKKAGRPKKKVGHAPGRRLEEVDIENFSVDEIKADITALTKQSVDKLKVVEQIKALQLKTEERKSKLVPRDLVRRVLGKLYQIDVNELRTLPDKLSSDIAAECKIDDTDVIFAINKLIEKEIYKTLEHMKRLLNDFLVGIKAERIE